jgi:cysteinyl-tRNA synthetase
MVAYIQDLIAHDRAYVAADGVYYDVERQPGYGKLSGRKLTEMVAGARIERDSSLRNPADFALWKHAKPGEPAWPSPWGDGRPGWHIECSVMSHETLGETFDIHAGGDDLKFPHHENEIAQGEAHGGKYACCWMHNGLIQYEGKKVGKSDERMKDPAFRQQFQAAHLLDTYGAATVRFLLLQGHYRRPNDFAPGALTAARTALGRMHVQLGTILSQDGQPQLAEVLARTVPAVGAKAREAFVAAMDDDFNTGAAIAQLFTLLSEARKAPAGDQSGLLLLVRDLGRLIGLFQPGDAADTAAGASSTGANEETLGHVMSLVLELRQTARANRDFATSDLIRDRLKMAGITVKDAKDGATWERL